MLSAKNKDLSAQSLTIASKVGAEISRWREIVRVYFRWKELSHFRGFLPY